MDSYGCIRLENQLCFPLYACAKEVVRRYRKPLEELIQLQALLKKALARMDTNKEV